MSEAMRSSLTTLQVLEIVGQRQPIAVSDVAKLIGRPKSTAQRTLMTLHEAGWIRPAAVDRTRWVLTTRATELARHVGDQNGLRAAAEPVLARLRDTTRESVSLYLLEGDSAVTVEFHEGRNAVRFIDTVGVRIPLHVGAAGKVLLAYISDDDRDRILAGPLPAFTKNTVTSRTKLARELAQIRADGYGASRFEYTDDVAGVAAAIRAPDGSAIASIAISGPGSRATQAHLEELGVAVREAAAEIEAVLAEGSLTEPETKVTIVGS